MAINSRAKGKRFELELAARLREYGYNTRRGQQFSGANGDADVVNLPGIHIEAKRREKLNLYDAIAQAKHDAAGSGKLPAVFHRKNNHGVLVTMELGTWMELYREWEAGYDPEGGAGK